MSTDINCVLQKLNKETGEFETVLTSVFGQDYALFGFLSNIQGNSTKHDGIAHPGLPADFKVTKTDDNHLYHNDTYMGEYGHGYLTLKEFCNASLPKLPSIADKFEVEKYASGYTVTFLEDEEEDYYASVRAYQRAFRSFFDTYFEGTSYGETYRFVFGYS